MTVEFKEFEINSQEELVVSEVGKAVGGDKLDAVLNVAGGWAGGNASSSEFIKVSEIWKKLKTT